MGKKSEDTFKLPCCCSEVVGRTSMGISTEVDMCEICLEINVAARIG